MKIREGNNNVAGIICSPNCDRVNWSAKMYGGDRPSPRFRQPCRVVGSENKWNCANTPDTRTSSPQGCILYSHINSLSKFSINIEKYLTEWYAFQSGNFCDSLWIHVLPYWTYLSLLSVVMLKPKSKCRLKISYILGHYSLKRGKKSGIIPSEAFVFDLAVEYWVQCDWTR